MGEARGCDGVSVVTDVDPHPMTLNSFVGHGIFAQIGQNPRRVDLAGRFHESRDHQISEYRIINDVEAQPVIDHAEHVIEKA
jgi:hypothetical protein